MVDQLCSRSERQIEQLIQMILLASRIVAQILVESLRALELLGCLESILLK